MYLSKLRFSAIAFDLRRAFQTSRQVHTERWQAIDISKRPEAAMHELLFVTIDVPLVSEELAYYRADVQPNLPWTDDHFLERVCGQPINPGVEWRNWPYAHSAASHLNNGKFNHNYMERYWPQYAGRVIQETQTAGDFEDAATKEGVTSEDINMGIYHEYGDLAGVVRVLAKEPLTRQAYLPVWFPEDTGDAHDGRKPCSLGYWFVMRDNQLHVRYGIRSCDFVRHYADDVYLTIRLLLWVLDQCRKINPDVWNAVKPGRFLMDIGSLHMFRNDWISMFGGTP